MARRLVFLVAIFTFIAASSYAQTTAITYQGKLMDGITAAHGNFDFEFRLFDSLSGGAQQGATVPIANSPVTNGTFVVTLDFGSQFPGAQRYLDISVRPAGSGPYAVLTPRQAVNSSPYSIQSLTAVAADSLSSNCVNCVTDSQINTMSASKLSGAVSLANGGTGAVNAPGARTNLGLGTLATVSPTGTANSTTFLRGDNTWSAGPTGPQGPIGPAGPVGITASINSQFSQDDRVGWTRIDNLADDQCFLNIPLGFTFTGWGRSNTLIGLSSNGVMFFGAGCSSQLSNTSLPSGMSVDPFLAFFWDDLRDFGTGEFVEYQTSGTAPGRVFNMYFRMRLWDTALCADNPVNMMISVHERSNLVNVTYSGMSGCFAIRGGNATFGMQGPGGAAADHFQIAYNSPILDDNVQRNSISFTPPRQ